MAQHRGGRGAGAPAQRPDPGYQLAEVERLGQVVIGAQAQALDPVAGGAGPGQHQDPRRRPPGGQRPADLIAAHAGQVPVQHHHVIERAGGVLQRVGAVEDHVDSHARPAQPGRDDRGQLRLVLDHQHPHPAPTSLPAHPVLHAGPAPGVQDASAEVAARLLSYRDATVTGVQTARMSYPQRNGEQHKTRHPCWPDRDHG
jgi:hypothetical protein